MKKSEIYNKAQQAVLAVPFFKTADKLEILRVLMSDEDCEKYVEKRKEQEAKEAEEAAVDEE